jgi:exopolysaccharide biosynthesis polyprenyl glycosylphosphotransferase
MLFTSIFNSEIREGIKKISSLHKNIRFLKRLLIGIEFSSVLVAIFLSYLFTFLVFNQIGYTWEYNIFHQVFFNLLILISWYVSTHVLSMAKLPRTQRYLNYLFSYIRVNFLILLILILLRFVLNLNTVPVLLILFYVTFSMFFILGIKFFATRILRIYRFYGHNIRQIMVIADDSSIGIIERLINQKEWGFRVKYIVSDSPKIKEVYGHKIPVLPDNRDIKEILDNHVIDEIIYSKSESYENEIRALLYICNEVGVIFRFHSSVSPINSVSVQLDTISKQNQLTLVDVPSNKFALTIKTMADLYFSITALIIMFPLLIIIGIVIKLESKGPILFKQERIGLRGRKFKLYKFRTMVSNAEDLLARLKAQNEADGPTFKIKDDPRVTRFGKFLRKTGLDELPQLFNVVSGEMSLIGPRPPIESEVKQYERWQLRRLSVKPGITCTWQIIPNRNDVKFEKWMQLDLNYIDNWSLAKDAELFFKTISTVLLATGR